MAILEGSSSKAFLYYLIDLKEDVLQRVYESHACVMSVFRMLPPVAQKCVFNLLYQGDSICDWRTWTKKRFVHTTKQALFLLSKLLEGDIDKGDLRLNLDFRMNYLSSLLLDGIELSGFMQHPLDEIARKSVNQDLFKKSLERWECILCYLALPSDSAIKNVSNTTRALFQHVGFTKGGDKDSEISSAGFQFLLLGRNDQIWAYIIYYLKFLESQDEDVFPVIEFLLKLTLCMKKFAHFSLCQLGQKNCKTLSRELGLIFIRKRKNGWFLLTPLMTSLVVDNENVHIDQGQPHGAGQKKGSSSAGKGFVIAETNFRVYAYTDSTLQLAILSTFTEFIYRFQDLVIGLMTRDSIRRALQTGITAKQIVQYLRANAHPQTLSTPQAKSVPITVVDQIYLWEQERKRLIYEEASLYSTFELKAEFLELRNFAIENKIALWYSDVQKIVVVSEEGNNLVKNWWSARKQTN